MTYTDHYKYEAAQLMRSDLDRLRGAAKHDKFNLFAAYCCKAVAAKEAGQMPLRDAAYSIAAAMFIKELEEPLFEDLTGLAGELELPSKFVEGDPEAKWQKLVGLVEKYRRHYESEAWLAKVEDKQKKMEQNTKDAFERYGDK